MTTPENIFLDQTAILISVETYLTERNKLIREKLERDLKNSGKDDEFIQEFIAKCKKEDEDFVKQFVEGYCSGISSLWAYAKWRQTQTKTYYLPIIAPKIDPDDIFLDSDWDMLAKSVIDSIWYEIRENLDELEKLLELSDEDVVVGLTALEGMEGFKRVVKNKEQLKKFILLGRSKKPDKVAIESENWFGAVQVVIDGSEWDEIEGRLYELKGLLKLSDMEVSTKLSELEGLDEFKNVVKNKEQLRSFILLGKYIEDNKIQGQISLSDLKRVPRDDYDWFLDTVKKFVEWDEKMTSLKDEDKDGLERFIQHIQHFQKIDQYLPGIEQGELAAVLPGDEDVGDLRKKKVRRVLEDTRGEEISKEYSIASLFTLGQLKELLKTPNFIQDRKLILISSHDHDSALFKDGDTYYYFDPNSETGEVEIIKIGDNEDEVVDRLARCIFEASYFEDEKPSPLGFRMFSFDRGLMDEYPSLQKVFSNEKITPTLDNIGNYADGYDGLIMSVDMGCLESAKYFLKRGIDPNVKDKDGITALILAINKGNVAIAKEILSGESEVAFDLQTENGWTVLMYAAGLGNLEIIQDVLSRVSEVNLDLQAKNGWTALMYAAKSGNPDAIKAILDRGASVNIQSKKDDEDDDTALMIAVYYGHLDVVREILKRGAEVDLSLQDASGFPVIIIAVHKRNLGIVSEILEKGVNVDFDYQDQCGWTALMYAAKFGDIEIVKKLLDAGANPNLRFTDGGVVSKLSNATALEIAEEAGHDEVAVLFRGITKVAAPESEQVEVVSKDDEEDRDVPLKM